MPQWKNPVTGQSHELIPVHIEKADAIEGALYLEDGTVLYVRVVPAGVVRAEGASDEFDRPIYMINAGQIVTVKKVGGQ